MKNQNYLTALLLIILALITDFSYAQWTQIGEDLDGKSTGEKFGTSVDLSEDGAMLAAGVPYSDGYRGQPSDRGHVAVYSFNGAIWNQIGEDIPGFGDRNYFGSSISLSADGKVVAAGALGRFDVRMVAVFNYDGYAWVNKGNKFIQKYGDGYYGFGSAISLNANGSVLAIGQPGEGGHHELSKVMVYTFVDSISDWVQTGSDIQGKRGDKTGTAVGLNYFGTRVAIGSDSCVKIFDFVVDNWIQMDSIPGGVKSPNAISFSPNGKSIAIGSDENVRVFIYTNNHWVQKGDNISWLVSGKNVSMSSDAGTISIGANNEVKVYDFKNNNWGQRGVSILGEGIADNSGANSLSADGSIVAIGALLNDANGLTDAGHVRVYNYSYPTIFDTISTIACDYYTTPSGKILYISGIYKDTLINNIGCDTVFTINLTVHPIYNLADTVTVCFNESIIFPDNDTLYNITESQSHTSKLLAVSGCDSIIVTTVIVNDNPSITITEIACNRYTSPSGKVWTSSGMYQDTLIGITGCDSIITISLTINQSYNMAYSETICYNGSFTFPDGKTVNNIKEHLIHSSKLQSATGCDSIIVTAVVVYDNLGAKITEIACNSYNSPSGKVRTSSGVYYDTLMGIMGCDSIVTIYLTLNPVVTNVFEDAGSLTTKTSSLDYQWIDCSNNFTLIAGEDQPFYTPPTSGGSYSVIVSNENCSDTSECFTIESTKLKKTQIIDVSIYPNPTKGQITVECESLEYIDVLNISGQHIDRIDAGMDKTSIDLSQQRNGMYIIKVKTRRGVFIEKIILNK